MYPFIELWEFGRIYTFWLSLMLCFFIFILILKKVCSRFWINFSFFANRILWFFLSTFIFSRIFYVISYWNDYKYIDSSLSFFLMSDYNFSLMWAIIWYFVVLFASTKFHKIHSWKYVDASILAFLFSWIVWYIWAFLGWQVYWKETYYWIEIVYNNAFSPIPYESWIFPLAIIYSIVCFIIFSTMYISAMFVKIRWIVWYLGFWLFASSVLILEQFTWKYDYFHQVHGISINKIFAIIFIVFAFVGLFRIAVSNTKEKDLTL